MWLKAFVLFETSYSLVFHNLPAESVSSCLKWKWKKTRWKGEEIEEIPESVGIFCLLMISIRGMFYENLFFFFKKYIQKERLGQKCCSESATVRNQLICWVMHGLLVVATIFFLLLPMFMSVELTLQEGARNIVFLQTICACQGV